MAHALQQPKFKIFDKYDFVKSFVAVTHDSKTKEEEEKKAAIIADAIQETQIVLLENLATKEDIKSLEKEIKLLEHNLTIKMAVIVGGFLTVLPLITDFIRHLFRF